MRTVPFYNTRIKPNLEGILSVAYITLSHIMEPLYCLPHFEGGEIPLPTIPYMWWCLPNALRAAAMKRAP